ncbi:hypothetical protein M378DRAFT_387532 [Amanita muscaria Koide BX008]|uniref:Uncharacterized protein n=1 Tax=Amanita muscaria (strain Koide BX008) TaxID=946122 RepID=A0A0C2SSR0_AMAMK|nr:hypothetical protein M378DRAFT_387532 [Amanita muscaria Koide BX008]
MYYRGVKYAIFTSTSRRQVYYASLYYRKAWSWRHAALLSQATVTTGLGLRFTHCMRSLSIARSWNARTPSPRISPSCDWPSQACVLFSDLARMQGASNMQLKELTFYNHHSIVHVGDLLTTFPSLKRIASTGQTVLDDDTINQLGSGLVAPCLEEFIIECNDIGLAKLLRMVKVRSSLGKRDVWQLEDDEPTPFRYVKLYWNSDLEEVPEEYKESIEEINRCDVQLIEESWDGYD